MGVQQGLKPQDVLVILKIVTLGEQPWRVIDLAQKLGISASEVSMGLERARRVGMLGPEKRKVMRAPLLEFLVHGLKYVFPAEPGPMCRGIPTAHSAPSLAHKIVTQDHERFVWPSEGGHVRGQSIAPLYPSVPHAVMKNPLLYDLLALVDSLRVGAAQERESAAQELRRRLGAGPA